jgi:hypothetical protein
MSDETEPITFITESLPAFIVDEDYDQLIEVQGGVPPLAWEIESGEFPPGINFGQGIVYGLPLEQDDSDTTVFITVSDATGASETQAFDCQVRHTRDDAG